MKISETRSILVAQCLEEADSDGQILSHDEKRLADAAAGAPLPQNTERFAHDSFLARRAVKLIGAMEPKLKGNLHWLTASTFRTRLSLLTLGGIVLAAVAGYLSNELSRDLGSRNLINLLAFPLMGIIAWSLLVYLVEIFVIFRKEGAMSGIGGLLARALYPVLPNRKKEDAETVVEFRARASFESRWRQLNLPPVAARIKALLHAAAFVLAAAAIAGMYVKGFSRQFNAVWESTFIENGAQLRPLLQVVLGPAAALQGNRLPSAAELDEIKAPNEKRVDGAARWINWYAITVGIYVLVPRLFLSVFWLVRAAARERRLPFREVSPGSPEYYARVISIATGDSLAVSLVPYAHQPSDSFRRGIRAHLEKHFKRTVTIDWHQGIPFGEEDETAVAIPGQFQPILLLNFASTPEKETHLALFRQLSATQAPGGRPFKVMLDCEAFERKAESFADAEDRRATRLEAWKKLFAAENCEMMVISDRSPTRHSTTPSLPP